MKQVYVRLNKDWLLSFTLIVALLFCLAERSWYDSASFLWILFALNISLIWAEFRFWAGYRWIWLPLSLISIIAFLHVLTGRTGNDAAGLMLIPMLYGFYLLARHLGNKLLLTLVVTSVATAVTAIIIRLIYPDTPRLGIGITHTVAFIILVGIVIVPAKSRWRMPMLMLGIPAVIMSNSEEGWVLLALITGIYLWKRYWNKKLLMILPTIALVLAVIIPNIDRFESLDRLTTHRQVAYVDYFHNGNLWYGSGWVYDVSATTIHNTPLKASSHYGLITGFSWLLIMLWALYKYRKTQWAYAFVIILVASTLDHFLWTYMVLWPFLILGLAEVCNVSNSRHSPDSDIRSNRLNHPD